MVMTSRVRERSNAPPRIPEDAFVAQRLWFFQILEYLRFSLFVGLICFVWEGDLKGSPFFFLCFL